MILNPSTYHLNHLPCIGIACINEARVYKAHSHTHVFLDTLYDDYSIVPAVSEEIE